MCGDNFFELLDAGAYVRLFGVCWVFESVQTGVWDVVQVLTSP